MPSSPPPRAQQMSMARNMPSCDHVIVEDEYIDMDVSSTTFLFSREFEFQMSANPPESEAATAPADELFYKGKLLPLHLPPRIRMVQDLSDASDENPATATATTKADSCHVSGELSQEECTYQCSAELAQPHTRTSWSKKLRLIRQSSLGLKLKASKAYLKSLFATKSKSTSADANAATLMRSIERERQLEEECMHRKSFSGAINCHLISRSSAADVSSCSSSSSSSSFSSVNSSRFYGSHVLTRSSSVNSEMENSIQGAIAHCKKSQVSARKSVSDVELCSRIVSDCEDQESIN